MKMTPVWATAALLLSLGAAQSQTPITDANHMTLYVFDNDSSGVSSCYDSCAANWPPYLGAAGETKGQGWSLIERNDGSMQWAFDGHPVYYFARDAKPGDMAGDGLNGVWHVLKE